MMRKQNVIIFSAGESLVRVRYLKEVLKKYDIICTDWKELFGQVRDTDNIALLPILTKKIPSFDFALILADGVDKTFLRREDNVRVMRDNVIFEMGLCVMALGADRVILMAEKGIRIPDDLAGIHKIGVKHIEYTIDGFDKAVKTVKESISQHAENADNFPPIDGIVDHIKMYSQNVSPVFIGAAIASAESYFLNFIIRLLENLHKPFHDLENPQDLHYFPEMISMKIVIPKEISHDIRNNISKYYRDNNIKSYCIDDAGIRGLYFNGQFTERGFCVYDIPTSVSASFSVVNAILSLDSDEEFDTHAYERFMAKELDIYEYALRKFITPEVARKRLTFIRDEAKLSSIIQLLENIQIEKVLI